MYEKRTGSNGRDKVKKQSVLMNKIQTMVETYHGVYSRQMKEYMSKMPKADNFTHFATWNIEAMVECEMYLVAWTTALDTLKIFQKEGYTDQKIVDWLKRCREHYLESLLNSSRINGGSYMSRMIETVRQDALKKIVGEGLLDSHSFALLINEAESHMNMKGVR